MISTSFPRVVVLRSTIFSPPIPSSLFLLFKRQIQPLHRTISLSSISSTPTCTKSQIPLFLRQPTSSATQSDLHKWQEWAKKLALSVGSKFSEADNGPEPYLLCRELKWLLEDAVVIEDHSSSTWVSSENEKPVNLRLDLEELYFLWNQRIQERRPFQYIVGCEHWRDLILCVQEGVLIPRPETEMLVDLVEEVILDDKRMGEGLWADLGTGSGAVAIAIGKSLGSGGRVIATDLSPIAASVAEFNVQRYGLQDKVEIRQGSWLEPLEDLKGKLVGLVSNPPYIPSDQISGLQAEVGRHEPKLALDGGENGMDDLLHLCEGAALMLKPGGFFAFELMVVVEKKLFGVKFPFHKNRTIFLFCFQFEEGATLFSGLRRPFTNRVVEIQTNGETQSKFLVEFMVNHVKSSFRDLRIVADFAGIQRFVTGFCR